MEFIDITIKAEPAENRIIRFIGTDETKDRDREILTINGWTTENYLKNPVFLFAHDYWSPAIGKAVALNKRKGALNFDIDFAPPEIYEFADTIYKLYKAGYMNAVSVGFIPDRKSRDYDESSDTLVTRKKELLELSAVPVPANPNALQMNGIKAAYNDRVIDEGQYKGFLIQLGRCIKALETHDEPDGLKPYPNEHSARLLSPDTDHIRVRRTQDSGAVQGVEIPKTIDIIWYIQESNGKEIPRAQALRFPVKNWTEAEARSWLKANDIKFISFEPAEESGKGFYDDLFRPREDVNPKHAADELFIEKAITAINKFQGA